MFKPSLWFAIAITLLAIFAALAVHSLTQIESNVSDYTAKAKPINGGEREGAIGDNQVIPPADLWEIRHRSLSARARAAREEARVQAVIDYIHTHNRFPPRTRPFDAAQQVVLDYIRLYQRVPSSAAQVNSPMQAVLNYIKVHHAMPPRTDPLDQAMQDVMDYIRVYGRVP